MELKRFHIDGTKVFLNDGSKGSFIKAVIGSVIKGMKNT